MNFTVAIYQRKRSGVFEWTTIGVGRHVRTRRGTNLAKVKQEIVDDLRKVVEGCRPADLVAFGLERGTELRRVRVEVTVAGDGRRRTLTGLCPIVIEPRASGPERILQIAYHPERPTEWLAIDPSLGFDAQIEGFLQQAWAKLPDFQVEGLFTDGKDLLRAVAFTAKPKGLLDQIASRRRGLWDDLHDDPAQRDRRREGFRVLRSIGIDRTVRRSGDGEGLGRPRSPFREQLQMLFAPAIGRASSHRERRSVIVVGPPGCGKSTIVERLIDDLLIAEDYPTHRNYDRVTHVWEISGKRIIAGMAYVGEWEKRVGELIEDVRGKPIVLYVPDLAAFGRIGQARDSSRSLADVLRTPVARGEVVILGEATEPQLARLEQDAPTFASLFARVAVRPASDDETFRILLSAVREIEATRPLDFDPFALRTLQELGGSLFPQRENPGKVVDLLGRMTGQIVERETEAGERQAVGPEEVLSFLASATGLPTVLLDRSRPFSRAEIEDLLEARVIGQEEAVGVAADLIVKIRSGLVDPKRPYAVLLFTGPTGTGKTELAKALAATLYGSEDRLLRFDMGEFGAHDGAVRLVGDRFRPDGALTRAIREQPFAVVLLDEIEKAHPSVLNLFLQLFEDGRLTDAAGELATFHHAVVVMTSNLGSRGQAAVGFESEGALGEERLREAIAADVAKAVREFFPPELFNRIDRIVPFRPLVHDVAVEVAEKELGKLLSRRGLSSRQIFVRANRAVVERVAAEAFRKADGARSLKRFLEDRIGTILGEQIAAAPASALRILHLFAAGDRGFRIEQEALVEATPSPFRSALDGLLEATVEELAPHAVGAVERLDAIAGGPALEALAETLRGHLDALRAGSRAAGDPIFYLDALRARVRELHERLDRIVVDARALDREALDRRHGRLPVEGRGPDVAYVRSIVARTPARLRLLAEGAEAGSASRRELLALLAEVHGLGRALDRAHALDRHAATIEIVPLEPWSEGRGRGRPSLLPAMVAAYAAALKAGRLAPRGEIDRFAVTTLATSSYDGDATDAFVTHGIGEAALRARLSTEPLDLGHALDGFHALDEGLRDRRPVVQVVFRVVGPCVTDLFEEETGTHVLEGHAISPDLVRIRVLAGAGDPVRQAEDFRAARARYERAQGDGPISRPDALLPIVRRIRREDRDPPRPGGTAPSRLAIEDYRLSFAETVVVRDLAAALAPIFLLRLAREAS
jgi:ATP-dependent Clp protease ATP-binding subunit ClpA/ATP-dependent Clp protease ATP-binding subunit ClpC